MNTARLHHLITILSSLTPEEFDIGFYFNHRGKPKGCALGWAAKDPDFNSEGLTLEDNYWPTYQGETSALASGREFFGLTHEESEIFTSSYYDSGANTTAGEVIAAINSIMAHKSSSQKKQRHGENFGSGPKDFIKKLKQYPAAKRKPLGPQ